MRRLIVLTPAYVFKAACHGAPVKPQRKSIRPLDRSD